MNVLVLHGPNLNLLGEREPEIYGHATLADINGRLEAKAKTLGATLKTFQSNSEGELLDRLHAERKWADALLINPGALTHSSYVLRDAIEAVALPTYEVHLSDIKKRESFRRRSVVRPVCADQVSGLGPDSYLVALELACKGGRARRKG